MKNKTQSENERLSKKLAKMESSIGDLKSSIEDLRFENYLMEKDIEWYKSELLRLNNNLTDDYYYERMIFHLTDRVGFVPTFEWEGKKVTMYRSENEKINLKTLLFRVISGIENPPKFLKDIIESQKAMQKISPGFESNEFEVFYRKYLDHRSETNTSKTVRQKKRK